MNPNPVDQWTNAELARWMAERDGWKRVQSRAQQLGIEVDANNKEWNLGWGCPPDMTWKEKTIRIPDYAESLDAAVAWIERRGFEWTRTSKRSVQVYKNSSYISEWATESPDCPTARALCIAAVKAQMEVEVKYGNI